ncbi:coiled-coil domain-containing protein 154 isoform X4 [Nematostella vectensis]|uniref:coiled-coil domain-containing protein 154 isoform X4 n=1 Tax=Nematostella vectensis TaxID=45351 RepID=UPI002076F874|nr:coiled-coil domain-containing protein 154 isoform X4 [Nematostella vectensis]
MQNKVQQDAAFAERFRRLENQRSTRHMDSPPWAKSEPKPSISRKRSSNSGKSLPALPSIPVDRSRRESPTGGVDSNRLRNLEGRLTLSEQSNRALLDELVRLQGELKNSIRRNEDSMRGEREERLVLSEKIQAANNLYTKLMMRLARTEEKLDSEHSAVGSLVNHTKQVEQTLMGNQQQLLSRREQIHVRLERLKEDLEDLQDSYEQVTKNARVMNDDIRLTKNKLEVQTVQFSTMVQELRQRMKKVESDSMTAMDLIGKQAESRGTLEMHTAQIKNNMEYRVSEIKELVSELRRRLDMEEAERRTVIQQAQLNIDQLKATVHNIEHKREEDMHSTSMMSRDKDSMLATERSQMASRLAEISDEQNKKLLQKEIRLREEAQSKFMALEKKLREEQESRLTFEKTLREEMERRWQSLKSYMDEEIQSDRGTEKLTQVRSDQSLARLNEAISILERQMEEGRKAVEQVLHAEITSRQSQHDKLSSRFKDMQDKLNLAISTLQQAVAGINTHVEEEVKKVKADIQNLLEQSKESGIKGLADMDTRVGKLSRRMQDAEEALASLDKKIQLLQTAQVTRTDGENSAKARQDISRWQVETEDRLREVDSKMRPLPDQMTRLKAELDALRAEMALKEATRRRTPTPKLQTPVPTEAEPDEETADIKDRMQKMEDTLQEQSSQISKIDSTVETLRTVLSQKIVSEAQARGESISELWDQLEKIKPDNGPGDTSPADKGPEKNSTKTDPSENGPTDKDPADRGPKDSNDKGPEPEDQSSNGPKEPKHE